MMIISMMSLGEFKVVVHIICIGFLVLYPRLKLFLEFIILVILVMHANSCNIYIHIITAIVMLLIH